MDSLYLEVFRTRSSDLLSSLLQIFKFCLVDGQLHVVRGKRVTIRVIPDHPLMLKTCSLESKLMSLACCALASLERDSVGILTLGFESIFSFPCTLYKIHRIIHTNGHYIIITTIIMVCIILYTVTISSYL